MTNNCSSKRNIVSLQDEVFSQPADISLDGRYEALCGITTQELHSCFTEKQQSEGRVDCIVETPSYIYIFEFKLDGTADEALQQIEDKGYARPYEADTRKLFKVSAVFSSETGTICDFKVAL